MKYFFALVLFFNTGCASASHIELGDFDITVDKNEHRIKILKDEAIYFTTSTFSTIAEVWRLPVIFQQDTKYIDSVIDEAHLFTVDDYIDCTFLNNCTNTYLKKNQLLVNEVAKPDKDNDICESEALKCLVVPTTVPGYTNEVLVYSSHIKAHYLRVLTKSTQQHKLQSFLNQISLKGIE